MSYAPDSLLVNILATQYSFSDPCLSSHTSPAPTYKQFIKQLYAHILSMNILLLITAYQLIQGKTCSPCLPAQVCHQASFSHHALTLCQEQGVRSCNMRAVCNATPALLLGALPLDLGSPLQERTEKNDSLSMTPVSEEVPFITCTRYLPLSKGITVKPVPKTRSFLVARSRSSSVIS